MTQEPETPPEPAARTGGRPVLWLAIIVVLILAAAAYWRFFGTSLDGSGAAAGAPPPTVTVSKPLQKEIVEWDEYTGQFAAVDYVEMRPRVSGYIESVHFKDGQLVKAGDLLYIIDPRPFEITLKSTQAQLEQAKAQ